MTVRNVPFGFGQQKDPRLQQVDQNFQAVTNDIAVSERRLLALREAVPWITVSSPTDYFQNGWSDYSSTNKEWWNEAQYRRIGDSIELRGLVRNGTNNAAIFTMPPGYVPVGHHLFPVNMSGDIHGRIDVQSDAIVVARITANAYASLSHIRYSISANGTDGWTAVSGGIGFTGTWVDYGSGYATAAYRKVGDMVEIRGLIKSGTINTSAFTLPPGYRPVYAQRFAVDSDNNAHGNVDIQPTGTVTPTLGPTGYYGLFGIRFSVSPPGSNGWTHMPFVSGWTDYDSPTWHPGEYRVIGDTVQMRGMIKGPGLGVIFYIPTEFCGVRRELFDVTAGSAHGRVSVFNGGQCAMTTGALTDVSMNNVQFSMLPI